MQATVDALERLHDYEDLDRALEGDYAGAALEDVDEEALRRTLGEQAVQDLRRLKQIERDARAGRPRARGGAAGSRSRRAAPGSWASARWSACSRSLKRDREGTHEARDPGGLAEPTGATRPWRFGDPGQIAVQRTVFNAVVRGWRERRARSGSSPTTSSSSRRSSAPRRRPRSCSTCRSRCRCAATSSTRRRWRSRCTP